MTASPDQVDPSASGQAGRLADLVARPVGRFADRHARREAVAKIVVLACLFAGLNTWQFRVLLRSWGDPDWSHGYIIPLFSLFLIWNRREELAAANPRTFIPALPMMILALLAQAVSFFLVSNYWLCQLSMVAVLFFLVLYLTGPSVIRVMWLPILYLALAMPIPGSLYTRVSVPLQEIAALGSAIALRAFGVSVDVTRSHLSMVSISGQIREVTVAEACSGMRSLMAYVALGVAWAYLEDRPVWQRVVLVVSIVPVAVFCNIVRVAITCTAYYRDRPEWGQEFMHTFTGMLMLIPALLLFLLLSWTLQRLFVEEDDDQDDTPAPEPGGAAEAQA